MRPERYYHLRFSDDGLIAECCGDAEGLLEHYTQICQRIGSGVIHFEIEGKLSVARERLTRAPALDPEHLLPLLRGLARVAPVLIEWEDSGRKHWYRAPEIN